MGEPAFIQGVNLKLEQFLLLRSEGCDPFFLVERARPRRRLSLGAKRLGFGGSKKRSNASTLGFLRPGAIGEVVCVAFEGWANHGERWGNWTSEGEQRAHIKPRKGGEAENCRGFENRRSLVEAAVTDALRERVEKIQNG